jgi:molecular chaperone GrpE
MENNTEQEATVDDNMENVEELKADSNEDQGQEEIKPAEENFKEKYFYLAAEMQNMQRRFDNEKQNLLKYGSEKILKDILDVVDNFERTLGFINKDEDEKVKNIAVGIEMINKQLIDSLSKHGLSQVEAMGKIFDPNFHEALAQMPAKGKKESEIIEVHQNGYVLNDRLLRPAKVIIAKN